MSIPNLIVASLFFSCTNICLWAPSLIVNMSLRYFEKVLLRLKNAWKLVNLRTCFAFVVQKSNENSIIQKNNEFIRYWLHQAYHRAHLGSVLFFIFIFIFHAKMRNFIIWLSHHHKCCCIEFHRIFHFYFGVCAYLCVTVYYISIITKKKKFYLTGNFVVVFISYSCYFLGSTQFLLDI